MQVKEQIEQVTRLDRKAMTSTASQLKTFGPGQRSLGGRLRVSASEDIVDASRSSLGDWTYLVVSEYKTKSLERTNVAQQSVILNSSRQVSDLNSREAGGWRSAEVARIMIQTHGTVPQQSFDIGMSTSSLPLVLLSLLKRLHQLPERSVLLSDATSSRRSDKWDLLKHELVCI